jgi:hypothetical protein
VIVRYNTIVNANAGNVGVSYDGHDNLIHNNVLVNAGEIFYYDANGVLLYGHLAGTTR